MRLIDDGRTTVVIYIHYPLRCSFFRIARAIYPHILDFCGTYLEAFLPLFLAVFDILVLYLSCDLLFG